MANLDIIRGRQLVATLTNKSGGSVAAGDVVVVDTTTDESFTTTTTALLERSIGIAQETIANNASGRVLLSGYAPLVNVAASVTRGHYLSTSAVAKQATGAATRAAGAFGQFLKTSATPSAWIWGAADQTGGAGGGRGEYASKYNPDHETPATAVADQEEFNTTTGMAWTAAPATADLATYPGLYRLAGDTTERHLSKAWTPGAVDVTIAAKFSLAAGTTLTGGLGIYLGNATGNPADMVLAWFEMQNATTKMSLALYNENTSVLSQVGTDLALGSAATALVQQVYLRLTRAVAGPTWTAYVSFDGITWYPVATTGSKALTIGAFGVRFATNQDIALDWVRVWSSVVSKVGA